MEVFRAIVLGIVQGATEFLPVSSSGHLVLIREFLGWEDGGLSFDIALHLGTLVALVIYFRHLWKNLLRDLLRGKIWQNRLFLGIIIATLPGVILGYFCEGLVSGYLRSAGAVGAAMILLGILFILVERDAQKRQAVRSKEVLAWQDYFWIGLAQAVALVPGISRSGATISAGMQRYLSRREAAEFSFLIAVPITIGSAAYDFIKNDRLLLLNLSEVFLGFLIAAVVGYLSISFLMRFLARRRLSVFSYYLFVVGVGALVFSLLL